MNDLAEPTSQIEQASRRYVGEYSYPVADEHRIRKCVRLIGASKTVLDVGAYDGQLSCRIRELGNDVTAMDASGDALEVARRKGLKTVLCDVASSWPVAADSFDVVFAGEIIEHIVDTDFFLQECKRVLKPAGLLVLTTPNLASLGRRLMLLLGLNPMTDTALRPEQAGHVRYFVGASIRHLLEDNGFRMERLEGDFISVTNSGRGSAYLANIFPALSRSLIVSARVETSHVHADREVHHDG